MNFNEAFSVQERQIISGYLSLMNKKPFDKITVKELSERSSIARTTFYRSFEGTYDLLERIERYLLGELVLYRSPLGGCHIEADMQAFVGNPYDSIKRFFQAGIRLRTILKPIMGEYGDPYFKERLAKRLRDDLDAMMSDEAVPNDELRPYYVATIAAAYIGLLGRVSAVEESDLLEIDRIVFIANSMRVAYFRSDSTAPAISDSRLFGA